MAKGMIPGTPTTKNGVPTTSHILWNLIITKILSLIVILILKIRQLKLIKYKKIYSIIPRSQYLNKDVYFLFSCSSLYTAITPLHGFSNCSNCSSSSNNNSDSTHSKNVQDTILSINSTSGKNPVKFILFCPSFTYKKRIWKIRETSNCMGVTDLCDSKMQMVKCRPSVN